MLTYSLNGKWKMRATNEQMWMDASVPGSVMNDLLNGGEIADPFYRDNEDEAYEVAIHDYEFKKDFFITDEMLAQDEVILRCEGLDTLSVVYLNDTKIATTNNMHRTYNFDVKSILKKGENNIKITLYSPLKYIENKQKAEPLIGVDEAVAGYPYIRKAHSMFGWDWGPIIPDLGIWRNITLLGWNKARIDDVYIKQEHQKNSVIVTIQSKFDKWIDEDIQLEVKVKSPDGLTDVKSIERAQKDERIVFTIENPQLWWPNGYGSQPLYQVDVEIKESEFILDKKTYKIGLRTIEIKNEPDQWGKSFEFWVNGISLFAMGANYIPEDSVVARTSKSRTKRLIQDCIEANFNMIRIWGGGYYPDDYFYELCDQYGLIVWQDFMFACSVYDLSDGFERSVTQEVIDNIKRIRHHASLGLWCGNNEVESAWEDWGWPRHSKYRTDYIKLFEIILPELINEHDPETFYWPSSPSSEGSFLDPSNPNKGDVHYWDVWHGLKPFTEYRKFLFRFCSEFGFQSFPSTKTIKTFTIPEDRNVFSYVMEKHQKNDGANGKILTYLADTFLYPKDFPSLIYTSQILQAEAIKYGVEHWRRHRGQCMGALYWQLNDCWPVASWSSIDYDGRWKALHYFTKRFYAPILLSIREEKDSAEIYVTNDSLEDVNGTVIWKLRTNTSKIIKEGKIENKVSALKAKEMKKLSFEDHLERRKTYLECHLYITGEYHSSATVLFVQPKHFQFLNPNIKLNVTEKEEAFMINVSAENFAKYVEMDLMEEDCTFSDNYFDISAGDVKTIMVKKDTLSKQMNGKTFKEQLVIRSLFDCAN